MTAAFPALRRFTVDEYHTMAEAGVFAPGERVELIDGYITPMSPFSGPHVITVNLITRVLSKALVLANVSDVDVSVQSPVRLEDDTEPEPDVALLRTKYEVENRMPEARDALLVIEVAVSTESLDREVKLPRYARAGIAEVWIVLPEARRVEVYREPEGDAYRTKTTRGDGDALTVAALPALAAFDVTSILPRQS